MSKPWHKRQKEQGAKLVLSWFAPRKCWKKYHDGEVKYFKHPDSAEGYESAVLEYHSWLHRKKQTRPLGAEYEHHIQLFRQCLDWYSRFGTPEDEEDMHTEITNLVGLLEGCFAGEAPLPPLGNLLPDGVTKAEKELVYVFCKDSGIAEQNSPHPWPPAEHRFGGQAYSLPGVWQERVRQLNLLASHRKKHPQTVDYHVKRFLAFKEMQVRGGVLKARTWGTLQERLTIFTNWIRPGTHVATINGSTIMEFYKWLLQQGWGQERRKNLFSAARQWIRWAWRQDDVELEILPKNIDSHEFVFLTHIDDTGVAKKTRTELLWTPDDFHRTLEIVPEDFQLFLLLMLNCGFTNIDVGTLLKSEIQLDEGRIVRQRTKTRRHEHPPVVNYKLWPRTAQLLRSRLSDDPVLALTNRGGRPLCVSKLVVENGTTREVVWSSLLRRYGQMKKANPKLPAKQMKYLRKTGSSKLRSDRRFLSLDSLYLGHSWVTVADKHYNVFDGQTYQPLDEAIEWLGKEFRLL
jgi:integrase